MPPHDELVIFDTTLRDGEQAAGASMSIPDKIRIAHKLEEMGVHVIDAGMPASSEDDPYKTVEAVSNEMRTAVVCATTRAVKKDIESSARALNSARNPCIHVFIATSEVQMRTKLRMEPQAVLDSISNHVAYARTLCSDVEFSAEDASRSDLPFLCEAARRAASAGASTVNVPDTVGYAYPELYAQYITAVREVLKDTEVRVAVHCHDDLGLATANSIAGIRAGARQVECTVNGIGERGGNAPLEEVAMALWLHEEAFGVSHKLKTEGFCELSKMVSDASAMVVAPNKAIVGRNAFAHASGIHQDGMLKCAQNYQIMPGDVVGAKFTISLSKLSGRHAVSDTFARLGYPLGGNAFELAFVDFKRVAERKRVVTEEDLRPIGMRHSI